MNRRDFLKTSAIFPLCAAGAASLGSFGRLFGQKVPNSVCQADASMKIGLNAYSFAKELNTGLRAASGGGSSKSSKKGTDRHATDTVGTAAGMSLAGLIDYAADPEHRFDAVDLTGYYFPGYSLTEVSVPSDSFVKKIRQYAADKGMPISGTGVGNTFTGVGFDRAAREGAAFSTDEGGDPEKLALDIARIKAWIEVAARLGAPVLRVFAGLEPSYLMKQNIKPDDPHKAEKADKLEKWRAETFKRMVDALHQLTPHAKQYGVVLGMQNHGDFLQTAEQCIEVVKAVDSEWFGLIVDTGYFQTPDPYADVEKVMTYAANFQLKEFARVSPHEYMTPVFKPMDVMRVMDIVRRSGYRGYIPIETLSAGKSEPYNPYREIPPFLAKVREAVAATAPKS